MGVCEWVCASRYGAFCISSSRPSPRSWYAWYHTQAGDKFRQSSQHSITGFINTIRKRESKKRRSSNHLTGTNQRHLLDDDANCCSIALWSLSLSSLSSSLSPHSSTLEFRSEATNKSHKSRKSRGSGVDVNWLWCLLLPTWENSWRILFCCWAIPQNNWRGWPRRQRSCYDSHYHKLFCRRTLTFWKGFESVIHSCSF